MLQGHFYQVLIDNKLHAIYFDEHQAKYQAQRTSAVNGDVYEVFKCELVSTGIGFPSLDLPPLDLSRV